MAMKVMQFFLYAFPATAKSLCSRTTAALLHFGSSSVLTVDFTAPSQHTDIRLNRTVSASLWNSRVFSFRMVQKYLNNHEKEKKIVREIGSSETSLSCLHMILSSLYCNVFSSFLLK